MKLRIILSSLIAVFFAGNSFAEGLSIEPGQWDMTMIMTMSMMPTPQTTTVSECMTEDELSPENFNDDGSQKTSLRIRTGADPCLVP